MEEHTQIAAVTGQRLTVSGPIRGTGPLVIGVRPLSFSGGSLVFDGTVELTNTANSYTGTTMVVGSTLRIPSEAVLGAAGSPLILTPGDSNRGAGLQTSAGLTLTRRVQLGSAYLSPQGGTATIDTNGFDSTIAGVISGYTPAFSLTKTGAGTLTLTALNNGYGGGTIISGGAVAVAADANLGAGGSPVQFSGGGLKALADLTTADRQRHRHD